MKRTVIFIAAALTSLGASAQKKDIVKTGLNFGPLPVVAYDADKGLQYGAILNIFDFGNGTNYPNYDSKWYFEASFFTKGSQLFHLMYDNKVLIPDVRWSSAVSIFVDKAMDFYGFNGYQSFYDQQRIADGLDGKDFLYSPFYRMNRLCVLAKSDLIGKITDNLSWEAGIHLSKFNIKSIDVDNINKGKADSEKYPSSLPTLYDNYLKWGLISEDEAEGGWNSSIRAGLVYDSRDKEGAPSRGIWAEGHFIGAPGFLGTTNPYARYSVTWRHYLPIVDHDILTFAYRFNYEGTFGNSAPYYVLPFLTVMGENGDKDGMGGYRTVRGIMRDRVMGLDMATYTAEFRWRFTQFQLLNQNIALALSAFSDGTMATRQIDMDYRGDIADIQAVAEYNTYMSNGRSRDIPHITFGGGFRFIMNENFIVAAEYGTPLTHLMKNSSRYNQDGTGAFYVNVGYLF